MRLTLALLFGLALAATAQPCRSDWSVVGIGGGEMGSAAYRCGATVGQSAAGPMSGTSFLAMIGYWQTGYEVGIAEREPLPVPGAPATALQAPFPNPSRGRAIVRYSLASESDVRLEVLDRVGRHVRTLVSGRHPAGHHDVSWDAADARGRDVSRGIYFFRFSAGDDVRTEKLMLVR